ncbi:ROMO1 protein, partial [Acromyrmex insinuator]
MMPVVPGGAYQQGPTCFDRMKLGFTIGFCVGMASGALFGGFSALRYLKRICRKYRYIRIRKFEYNYETFFRYGLRGKELLNSVGKVMLQGGGTFGTFMAIGTGIRC